MKKNKKDMVIGLGEIGTPIYKTFSKSFLTIGYDKNPKLMNSKKFKQTKNISTELMNICIPFSKNFIHIVSQLVDEFNPSLLVIHSTISPNTTRHLQKKLKIPVIYSATRGVHKRMLNDLKRYQKFFSVYDWAPRAQWARKIYKSRLTKAGIRTKQMSSPLSLELAKIVVDTSYYGWLINYAQVSYMIAKKHKVDYDEMWSFSDEIHKFLGNRPKMFPGFIGGHCVIPNLDLIQENSLFQIDKINNMYAKKIKNSKSIKKKYDKSKKSSYDSSKV